MKGDKVKVFTLAKRYGFKSREFVDHLKKIGFSVSSYQASLDTWDVPVIEERLVKGGLLDPAKATTIEEPDSGEDQSDTVGWKVVVQAAPPPGAEDAEDEEEEAGAEAEAEEEAGTETAPEAAEENQEEQREALAEEPAPEEKTRSTLPGAEIISRPLPLRRRSGAGEPTSEPAAAEAPAVPAGTTEPAGTGSAGTGPARTTGPATPAVPEPPAAEEMPAAAEQPEAVVAEAGAAPQAAAQAPASPKDQETPKPRPRAGATKVGKIDLATLGKLRARRSQSRSVTFTDIRERESSRRHQERTKQREKSKSRRAGTLGPKKVSTQERKADVVLEPPVTVKSFSAATGIGVNQILGKLMSLGTMANINAVLDEDTVQILADEYGMGIRVKEEKDIEESLMSEIEAARQDVDDAKLAPRPPVIAFLGHVDHGKTSLIDALRMTKVVEGEAGGITQHIGAYRIEDKNGRSITIIDTPGHEAFTAMRARGAQTTDIVILVVAADDGVMPQTQEAINHARLAEVPIIVALNKVDKANANTERVKTQLASLGLQAEDWGGDTAVIEVSAIQKTGLEELMDRVLLESELLALKAHTDGEARGTVLEASHDQGRGKVATVLVQDGTLNVGDALLAGPTYGTVRRMFDHTGQTVTVAGPSTPVEILGLSDLPAAGDRFYVVQDAATAKDVAEKRLTQVRESDRAEKSKVSLENLFDRIDSASAKQINLIVKADVQGSLEVLSSALEELSTGEVKVKLVHTAVGGVTESDILLAETAHGVVIAFGVVPDEKARSAAERSGIEIRRYNVIYELLEDIQKAMVGLLSPERLEKIRGHAEVRAVFRSSKFGNIAGCFVTDGLIKRNNRVRLIRDSRPIFEGDLDNLRRLKDDVREVRAGLECGMKLRNYEDLKEGDIIESFDIVEQARSLESAAEGS